MSNIGKIAVALVVGIGGLIAALVFAGGVTLNSSPAILASPTTLPALTSPAAGAILSGTVPLAATADPTAQVSRAQFHLVPVGGAAVRIESQWRFTQNQPEGVFNSTLDTTKYPDGQYTVYFDHYDAANTRSRSGNAVVTFSNAAVSATTQTGTTDTSPPPATPTPATASPALPKVVLSVPTEGVELLGTTTLTATTDPTAPVVRAQFHLVDAAGTELPIQPTWRFTSTPMDGVFSTAVNTKNYPNGKYIVYFDYYDASDTRSRTLNVNVTIKNPPPPPVRMVMPTSGAAAQSTLTMHASTSPAAQLVKAEFHIYSVLEGAEMPIQRNWRFTSVPSDGQFKAEADVSAYNPGDYTAYFNYFTPEGVRVRTENVSFKVIPVPSAGLVTPKNGSNVISKTILYATTTPSTQGFKGAAFHVVGSNGIDLVDQLSLRFTVAETSQEYFATVDTSALQSGRYKVYFAFEDTVGKVYKSKTALISIAKSCLFNGVQVASGRSVTAYKDSASAVCESQERICTDGVLSGVYANASCNTPGAPNTVPFKSTIEHDYSSVNIPGAPWAGTGNSTSRILASFSDLDDFDSITLGPGTWQVPLWNSKRHPMPQHLAWFQSLVPWVPIESLYITPTNFLLAGGDPLKLFVTQTRVHPGQLRLFAARLQDVHYRESFAALETDPASLATATLRLLTTAYSRFVQSTAALRIGTTTYETLSWHPPLLDWSKAAYIPAGGCMHSPVTDEVLATIQEALEYNVDGVLLDFMRFPAYFNLDTSTSSTRKAIISCFVSEAKKLVSANGSTRVLGAYIPWQTALHDQLGIDVAEMDRLGVNFISLGSAYNMGQPHFGQLHESSEITKIKNLAPNVKLYYTMYPYMRFSEWISGSESADSAVFRISTPQAMYTTAHIAYSRGVSGMNFFNMQYYRKHGDTSLPRQPFTEPLYKLIPGFVQCLESPSCVAANSEQFYYVPGPLNGQNFPKLNPDPEGAWALPKTLTVRQKATFSLDMAPPAGGWIQGGKMRLQVSGTDASASIWKVTINGKELREIPDTSEMYSSVYVQGKGSPGQYKAWLVDDVTGLKNGMNTVEVTVVSGQTQRITWIELSLE